MVVLDNNNSPWMWRSGRSIDKEDMSIANCQGIYLQKWDEVSGE